jgi:hypothetical protein
MSEIQLKGGHMTTDPGDCCVRVVRDDGPAHAEDELFLSGEE